MATYCTATLSCDRHKRNRKAAQPSAARPAPPSFPLLPLVPNILGGQARHAPMGGRKPVSSHLCHVVVLNGEKYSTGGLTLNPAFTDWLMGRPDGWTDPGRPVTALSLWLQHARGAC